MAKSDYISSSDTEFGVQLQTFQTTIPTYNVTLGVSAGQMTAQAADSDYFNYVIACREIMHNGSRQWGQWRDRLRKSTTNPPGGAPMPPVLPASVPSVNAGVEARFRSLVKQIKANANYNEAIGSALGIEGVEQTGPDLATVQAEIEVKVFGNEVLVKWNWGGNADFLDMCELQVDRNDGKGFVLLAYDTTPNYLDGAPFPAAPSKWTYRAIYRVGDQRVGQWSNPVSVMVG